MFRLIFPSRHRRGRGLFGAASNPKRSTAEESQQLADNALAQALWFVRRSAAIANMITLEDCVGLCGLTEEEVLAIAEHEHLPEIAAASLAAYLLSQQQGSEKVLNMIVDDIRQAQHIRGDKEHVTTLLHVLHHFLKTHPEARPSHHPWSKRF
jgi:hypothetical protein